MPTEQLDVVARLSPTTAVGRLTWGEPNSSSERNAYYFLVLDSAWRIEAIRASVVPLFTRRMVEAFDQNPDAARAAMAQMGQAAEPAARAIEQARREMFSDQQLRAWFSEERVAFERIAERVRELESGRQGEDAELRQQLDAVNLRTAELLDGGRVEITVGGWADNAVGFGHAPDWILPAMDADRRIWVEALGEGWYLYRAT